MGECTIRTISENVTKLSASVRATLIGFEARDTGSVELGRASLLEVYFQLIAVFCSAISTGVTPFLRAWAVG